MSIGDGNGSPPQYACLEKSMDGGAWWAIVHGVAKSWIQLSNFTQSLTQDVNKSEDSGKWFILARNCFHSNLLDNCGQWKLLGVGIGRSGESRDIGGLGRWRNKYSSRHWRPEGLEGPSHLCSLFFYSPISPGCLLLTAPHLTLLWDPRLPWSPAGASPLSCSLTQASLSFLHLFCPCQLPPPYPISQDPHPTAH